MRYPREVFVERIEKVFFLAMNNGYATEIVKEHVPGLPGSRLIKFEHEEENHHWLVNDLFFVSPNSPHSSGITTICYDSKPVWSMSYSGQYPEGAIPLLKQALQKAYRESKFFGGRGPAAHLPIDLPASENFGEVYINCIGNGDFKNFWGTEQIVFCGSGLVIGYHQYRGGIMLPQQLQDWEK